MGGQRGSNGVVPGYTALGDLRGHQKSSMSWVCEALGGVTAGWPIRAQRSARDTLEVITLTWDGT